LERLLNHTKYFLIVIIVSSLGITYLHYSTLPGIHELHNIFTELYYIPLLLGALAFGFKGAVVTFVFVTILYAPYIYIHWSGTYLFIVNQLFHALFSGSFAIIAGVLTDRERKRQKEIDKDRYLAGLGRAAAAIVHDLKNPIISILGFSRRIMEQKGDVETASQIVMSSAENMQKIVHNVLDFARPVQLDLHEDNVNSVIRRACDSCKTKAEEAGILLSVNLPAAPIMFMFDSVHLERALMNLISNAIEASGQGDTVYVYVEPGDQVSVRIKDAGKGMDRETLDNMFIPFYTQKSTGTGIGMAIVKKIIEGHGGNIYVESRTGMGTEILIKLNAFNKLI
jgi:signal transduction histidine kinase